MYNYTTKKQYRHFHITYAYNLHTHTYTASCHADCIDENRFFEVSQSDFSTSSPDSGHPRKLIYISVCIKICRSTYTYTHYLPRSDSLAFFSVLHYFRTHSLQTETFISISKFLPPLRTRNYFVLSFYLFLFVFAFRFLPLAEASQNLSLLQLHTFSVTETSLVVRGNTSRTLWTLRLWGN